MRRFLYLAGSLAALGTLGYFALGEQSQLEVEAHLGQGRYRDGRGRWGREGPAAATSQGGGAPSSACPTCLTDLAAYWSFDTQTDGGITDWTGNGHDGLIITSMSWSPAGLIAEALQPIAPSGSVGLSIVPAASLTIDAGTAFAISTWVNIQSQNAGNYTCLVCESSSKGLYTHGTKFSFYNGADHDSTATWSAGGFGTWTHFVANYDGTAMTYWVNGVQDITITPYSFPGGTFVVAWIAGVATNNYAPIGLMDETAVFFRALTEQEILALNNSGAALPYSSF